MEVIVICVGIVGLVGPVGSLCRRLAFVVRVAVLFRPLSKCRYVDRYLYNNIIQPLKYGCTVRSPFRVFSGVLSDPGLRVLTFFGVLARFSRFVCMLVVRRYA